MTSFFVTDPLNWKFQLPDSSFLPSAMVWMVKKRSADRVLNGKDSLVYNIDLEGCTVIKLEKRVIYGNMSLGNTYPYRSIIYTQSSNTYIKRFLSVVILV
jgi:hypothetical protein